LSSFSWKENHVNSCGFNIKASIDLKKKKKIDVFPHDSMLMNAKTYVFAISKYNFSFCLRFDYIFISNSVKLLNKDHA